MKTKMGVMAMTITFTVAVCAETAAIKYSLPQFGNYVNAYGAIREKLPADKNTAKQYRLRSVEELMNEWFSSCLDKSNVPSLTKEDVAKWKAVNLSEVDERFRHLDAAKTIDHLGDVLSYIAAEYAIYGLNAQKLKTCVGYVNKLAKDKWTLGILGGKLTIDTYRAKANSNFANGVQRSYGELRRLIGPLETIHRKEFVSWAQKNPQQYATLKRNDDSLENNILLQAKVDEATEAGRRAEMRAAAAQWAAEDAARKAEDAKRAADSAAFQANDAAFRARNGW